MLKSLGSLISFALSVIIAAHATPFAMADEPAAAAADPYAVPETDNAAELAAFINKLQKNAPSPPRRRPQTDEERAAFKRFLEHQSKAPKAIKAAAEKILAIETDKASKAYRLATKVTLGARTAELMRAAPDQQKAIVGEIRDYLSGKEKLERDDVRLIMQATQALARGGNRTLAAKSLKEFTAIVEKNENSDLPGAVQFLRMQLLNVVSDEEKGQLIAELKQELVEGGLNQQAIGAALELCQAIEQSGDTELAGKTYKEFGELALASDDEDVKKAARYFVGPGRRLGLLGNKMEVLQGTPLDGGVFDWELYRGKVVLVDFWATWCGPCVAEMPNVRKNYDLYHERGFDVVGISLDRAKAPLEKFVKEKDVPWVTLFDGEPGEAGSMAQYYGIRGIPTVILVDREGKVVSLNARGPKLGQLLGELIGPPEAEKEAG
jgi:thiol-disulfide isomerase/thioredoxin